MDNSFVTNSFLKVSQKRSTHTHQKTNPKDELSLFLGPDAGVVVEFKEEEFNQSKGILSKSTVINYQHTTTIKNTKAATVCELFLSLLTPQMSIDVFDQFPQSTEDKVKGK